MAVTIPVACANCGAPLEIPSGVSYFTCSYCSSALQVKQEGGVIFSAIRRDLAQIKADVQGIKEATTRNADSNSRVLLELEHARLEREHARLEQELAANRAAQAELAPAVATAGQERQVGFGCGLLGLVGVCLASLRAEWGSAVICGLLAALLLSSGLVGMLRGCNRALSGLKAEERIIRARARAVWRRLNPHG